MHSINKGDATDWKQCEINNVARYKVGGKVVEFNPLASELSHGLGEFLETRKGGGAAETARPPGLVRDGGW